MLLGLFTHYFLHRQGQGEFVAKSQSTTYQTPPYESNRYLLMKTRLRCADAHRASEMRFSPPLINVNLARETGIWRYCKCAQTGAIHSLLATMWVSQKRVHMFILATVSSQQSDSCKKKFPSLSCPTESTRTTYTAKRRRTKETDFACVDFAITQPYLACRPCAGNAHVSHVQIPGYVGCAQVSHLHIPGFYGFARLRSKTRFAGTPGYHTSKYPSVLSMPGYRTLQIPIPGTCTWRQLQGQTESKFSVGGREIIPYSLFVFMCLLSENCE